MNSVQRKFAQFNSAEKNMILHKPEGAPSRIGMTLFILWGTSSLISFGSIEITDMEFSLVFDEKGYCKGRRRPYIFLTTGSHDAGILCATLRKARSQRWAMCLDSLMPKQELCASLLLRLYKQRPVALGKITHYTDVPREEFTFFAFMPQKTIGQNYICPVLRMLWSFLEQYEVCRFF